MTTSTSSKHDSEADEPRIVARNAIAIYSVRGLLALSALLLTPYLFRTLGTGGFGTWSVMFTITTVFGLLEFGFAAGCTKLVSELRAKGQRAELERTVGTSVTLMALLGVVAFGVALGAALFLDSLAAPADRDDFRLGLVVLGAAMLLRFPAGAYGAALIGYQRSARFSAGEAVTVIAFMAGAVIAVESNAGVLGLAVAYGLALVAGGAVFAVLLRATDPVLPLRPRLGDRRLRRQIASFSSFTLLADAMIFLGARMDTVIVAAIRGASAAAPFAAAVKLQSALQSLTSPFLVLLMPMLSELWAAGRRDEVRERLVLATRVASQVTLPVAVAVSLYATDIVDIWLGSDAPSVTATIIILLMAVQTVTLSTVPAERALVGIGRVRAVGGLAFIEGLSNFLLSVVLISSYGVVGAAIGSLVAGTIVAPLKFPVVCRHLDISTWWFLGRSVARAVVSSVPGIALMVAVFVALQPGIVRLALGIVLGLGACAAIGVRQLGLDQLRSTVRQALGRASGPGAVAEEGWPVEA